MKTLNMNSKIAGLFGMMMLSLTGCGSSNNNAATPIGVPNGAYCSPGYSNCAQNGMYGTSANGILARASGEDGGQKLQLDLSFVGQSQASSYAYSGPYSAVGYIVIANYLAQSCPVPPGTYQIQTVNAGSSWNSGTNLALQMIASGPTTLHLTLSNAYVSSRQGGSVPGLDGQPFENWIGGSLQIAECQNYPAITIGI